jgi:hypothetical protein
MAGRCKRPNRTPTAVRELRVRSRQLLASLLHMRGACLAAAAGGGAPAGQRHHLSPLLLALLCKCRGSSYTA